MRTASPETIGRRVRALRERRGCTQLDVAQLTLLAPKSISEIERGLRKPRGSTMRVLADALGCTPAELLRPDALLGDEGTAS